MKAQITLNEQLLYRWTETNLLPMLLIASVVVILVILTILLLIHSRKPNLDENPLKSPADRLFIFLTLVAVFMLGAFLMFFFFV